MKYYLIAGERSGDLHASNLILSLKKEDAHAQFRVWGGDYMEAAGAIVAKHYRELAFMGFWEVAKNLPTILGFIKECQRDILAYKPDVIILVDYAGFNMRIAKFAKKHNIKVFYYISPKVWAWNQSRAYKIKEYVDRLFVIFPFEKDFFKKYEYEVDFVGNPLLDAIEAFKPNPDFKNENKLSDKPIIALLPGSRKQEVDKMLEIMLSIAPQFPQYQFVIAAVTNLPASLYEKFTQKSNVEVVYNKAYDLLSHAQAALVTSGTATLETALFEVPQVVCYKTGSISYWISKALIKVRYISLVNLIVDREVVKELIQDELNTKELEKELRKILPGSVHRQKQLDGYREIKNLIGTSGASQITAKLMTKYLNEKQLVS